MHYFKRNIGDYAKKAGRLSMLQHGSYTLLIDACYDREQFPTKDEAIEWTWASSAQEIEAVEFVLRKFFNLEDGRYVQQDIQRDITDYHAKAANNKRIADEREAKRRGGDTNRARTVDEAPPNHKPLTTNQEPLTIVDSVPNGTGGKPPMLTDPKEIIFGYGLSMLVSAGTPEKQARSFLGGLAKHHGEPELIDKLRECAKARPLQPLEWLAAALPPAGPKPKLNKQEALEASNREVARRFIEKLESEHEQE